MIRIKLLIILLMVLFAGPVHAAVTISSFPYNYEFDDSSYTTDHLWITGGATQTYLSSGGWDGNGAVKITPPTSSGGYGALGQYNFPASTTRVNVRWLLYHGANYEETNPNFKTIIMEGASLRPMIIEEQWTQGDANWLGLGSCYGTTCRFSSDSSQWSLEGDEALKIGRGGRSEEWICLELEGDTSTGLVKLYITTEDGELEEYEVISHQGPTGGNHSYFWVGAYTDNSTTNNADNYYIIDALAVDDSYIGCPDGFGSATPTPTSTGIYGNFQVGGN